MSDRAIICILMIVIITLFSAIIIEISANNNPYPESLLNKGVPVYSSIYPSAQ